MKKLFFLLAISVLIISCCKDDDDNIIPYIPPNDTTIVNNWDNTALHQYNFVFGESQLKSTNSDTSDIKYIKFISYDSEDKPMIDGVPVGNGQRNVHEIEVFSNLVNIAQNPPYFDTTANMWAWHADSTLIYGNSVEGHSAGFYDINYLYKAVDNDFNSAWTSNRDDGQDTVYCVVVLNKIYPIDSIRLTLGFYKQTFDVFVSNDSLNWILIGGENHPEIPIYIQ